MREARRWLEDHASGSPSTLRAAMDRALNASTGDAAAAETLAAAGLGALAAVVAGHGERVSAVDLLAADALLTCACQAAAEAGPGAVEALTSSLEVARFEALLTEGAA